MFPTFTHLPRWQLHLSLHRRQSDEGLQLETGLLPSYALVTVESYALVSVASFEFIASIVLVIKFLL